jgi:hypothetical protein
MADIQIHSGFSLVGRAVLHLFFNYRPSGGTHDPDK